MIYRVHWKSEPGSHRSISRFATWDGVVVDSTQALIWLRGKKFEEARIALGTRYEASVTIEPGSIHKRSLV